MGSAGMDQQIYYNLQDRDEGNRRESEGVMAGLDWAKDIIEQRVNRPGKGETHPAPARESPRVTHNSAVNRSKTRSDTKF